jgi:hypothetical protein
VLEVGMGQEVLCWRVATIRSGVLLECNAATFTSEQALEAQQKTEYELGVACWMTGELAHEMLRNALKPPLSVGSPVYR